MKLRAVPSSMNRPTIASIFASSLCKEVDRDLMERIIEEGRTCLEALQNAYISNDAFSQQYNGTFIDYPDRTTYTTYDTADVARSEDSWVKGASSRVVVGHSHNDKSM